MKRGQKILWMTIGIIIGLTCNLSLEQRLAEAFWNWILSTPENTATIYKTSNAPVSDALHRAFLDHEKHDFPDEKADIARLGPWMTDARWEGYRREAGGCPAIAEVTKVDVTKDTDNDYVITMFGVDSWTDSDGFAHDVCSLWMSDQTNEVRSLSPY